MARTAKGTSRAKGGPARSSVCPLGEAEAHGILQVLDRDGNVSGTLPDPGLDERINGPGVIVASKPASRAHSKAFCTSAPSFAPPAMLT